MTDARSRRRGEALNGSLRTAEHQPREMRGTEYRLGFRNSFVEDI
jgi:hypothetical protein